MKSALYFNPVLCPSSQDSIEFLGKALNMQHVRWQRNFYKKACNTSNTICRTRSDQNEMAYLFLEKTLGLPREHYRRFFKIS